MTLFLSRPFLRRLGYVWFPELKAFLAGDRNLLFFVPDSVIVVPEITVESIDRFLSEKAGAQTELLGYLSPERIVLPGSFVEVVTSRSADPSGWKAFISLPVEEEMKSTVMEIQVAQ